MTLFLSVFAGVFFGALITWFVVRHHAMRQLTKLDGDLRAAMARLDEQTTQCREWEQEVRLERAARSSAEQLGARLQGELEAEKRSLVAQKQVLEDAKAQLTSVFRAIGSEELSRLQKELLNQTAQLTTAQRQLAKADFDKSHQAIEASLKPVRDLLDHQRGVLGELDRRNAAAYSSIETQIKGMLSAADAVRSETGKLSTALRRSDARGRWGETALRNLVEMAGMSEHVDFDVQVHVRGDDGGLRPDLVIKLPGGGNLVVDAKVPLEHYLAAQDGDTTAKLIEHANAVRRHIDQLSTKAYWNQFEHSPSYVVMFIPIESALAAAFIANPDLQEHALRSRVVVASSGIFLGLLQTVGLFWRQEQLAENARAICDAGSSLYERLTRFATHIDKMGDSLSNATKRFNSAVGSFESRVLPAAKTLKSLKVTSTAELEPPVHVEIIPRRMTKAADEEPMPASGEGAQLI